MAPHQLVLLYQQYAVGLAGLETYSHRHIAAIGLYLPPDLEDAQVGLIHCWNTRGCVAGLVLHLQGSP